MKGLPAFGRLASLFFVAALTLVAIGKLTMSPPSSSAQTTTDTKSQTSPQPQPTPQSEQQKILADLTRSIAGRETEPAEKVWKNIQAFKGRPAAVIPRAMNGFSRALGVSCSHCHTAGEWEKEDLPTKQVAREMVAMVQKIDDELLKNIKNLKSENPQVSCSTCHRGQVKPETRLPEPVKPS